VLDHISRDPEGGAVRALGDMGAEAVPGLRKCLHQSEPNVRAMAAKVLGEMGVVGQAARDDLLAALKDPSRDVRCCAIEALGYLGPAGGPAAKRLAELVAAPDRSVRRRAIEALGRMGREARGALAALEKAAKEDGDGELAAEAVKQIDVARLALEARLGASGEMRHCLEALGGRDADAAVAAAEALGKMGFEGRSGAPALALMLRDADRKRRLAAAKALGQLGLGAVDFRLTLEAAAREEDAEVRAAAARPAKALRPSGGKP
jgi:HEAT repeat protein